MSYAHQLVINLLLLRLKLHGIGERLPFASSAYAEMAAERLYTLSGRLDHPQYETFHIVFLLFRHLHVDNVSRNGERHEKYGAVYPGKGFSFGGYRLYQNIFQNDILFFSSHFHRISIAKIC